MERGIADSRGAHGMENPRGTLCGEPSSSTRATSPRQLPTDHDCAVSTREYQNDQPSRQPSRLPPMLRSPGDNAPEQQANLTGRSISVSRPRGSRNKWRGLQVEGSLGEARNAGEDLIGAFGPDKRFRSGLMRGNKVANRRLQLGTVRWTPRRSCLLVSSANQHSTRFNQEP